MDKQTKKFYLKIAFAFLVIAFLVYKNPKSPGSIYAPDMAFSRAYETYAEGPISTFFGKYESKMAALLPVANTISTHALPSEALYKQEPSVIYSYNYTRYYKYNDSDKVRAGLELKNPFQPTPEVLKRGEAIYKYQCAICHGKNGMGDGPLIVREDGSEGAYKAVPPAYSDRLKTLKDGEMYHSITYGKNLMGGYGSHVRSEDRWKLVCYIKELGGLNKPASSDSSKVASAISSDSTKKM